MRLVELLLSLELCQQVHPRSSGSLESSAEVWMNPFVFQPLGRVWS